MAIYNKDFFDRILDGSLRSARNIVPVIVEKFKPTSVIDFGCGTGAWLSVFKENSIPEVLGLDGFMYESCLLDKEEYKIINLSQKIFLDKKYSLAISLEVAEHLPESAADVFVENVSSAADIIIWSAATPGQGGDDHINEQPHSYWIQKFQRLGFESDENFKNLFKDNLNIEPWYKNNIIIFKK
jgi:hypothetical protein